MFALIRYAIFFVLLVAFVFCIRKRFPVEKRKKCYCIGACVGAVLLGISMYLPIENLFYSFESPEAVYEYVFGDTKNVRCVIEGKDGALVVTKKQGSVKQETTFIPKGENGWKIGSVFRFNSYICAQKTSEFVVINVWRYNNTSDYYVYVAVSNKASSTVSDSCDSEFVFVENEHAIIYYAYIPDYDSEYYVVIDGEKHTLQEWPGFS